MRSEQRVCRIEQMKKQQQKRQELMEMGHGKVEEIFDEKDFFK